MTVESALFETLRVLVSDRVYPDVAPHDITALPRVTYQAVGGRGLNFLEPAPVGIRNFRFQISTWGKTRVQVAGLSRQVEDALRSNAALNTTVLSAPITTYESDTKLYGAMQDFSCWY